MQHRTITRTCVAGIVLFAATAVAEPPASQPGHVVLTTHKVNKKRSEMTFTGLLPGSKTVRYQRAADINVDGEKFTIYLPKADRYSTKHTGKHANWLGNNSTRVFVDANTDGTLDEHEGWFTDLPVRIADRNYRVEKIANDASRIEMSLLDGPLTGLVLGRKVPPFKLTTADGQTVTPDTYRGKAFLLDIWSVT